MMLIVVMVSYWSLLVSSKIAANSSIDRSRLEAKNFWISFSWNDEEGKRYRIQIHRRKTRRYQCDKQLVAGDIRYLGDDIALHDHCVHGTGRSEYQELQWESCSIRISYHRWIIRNTWMVCLQCIVDSGLLECHSSVCLLGLEDPVTVQDPGSYLPNWY